MPPPSIHLWALTLPSPSKEVISITSQTCCAEPGVSLWGRDEVRASTLHINAVHLPYLHNNAFHMSWLTKQQSSWRECDAHLHYNAAIFLTMSNNFGKAESSVFSYFHSLRREPWPALQSNKTVDVLCCKPFRQFPLWSHSDTRWK